MTQQTTSDEPLSREELADLEAAIARKAKEARVTELEAVRRARAAREAEKERKTQEAALRAEHDDHAALDALLASHADDVRDRYVRLLEDIATELVALKSPQGRSVAPIDALRLIQAVIDRTAPYALQWIQARHLSERNAAVMRKNGQLHHAALALGKDDERDLKPQHTEHSDTPMEFWMIGQLKVQLRLTQGTYHCDGRMDATLDGMVRTSERIVKKGETFEVYESEAARLIEAKVAERVNAAEAAK